jgi:Na+-translocating ferredoxin:NAD+ oxidoreductase subunit D
MNFSISPAPHINNGLSYKKIMWYVVIALLPAMLVSFYVFGIRSLLLISVSIASCVLIETFIKKMFFNDRSFDASPLITGLLLAYNIPSSLPLWELIIGCFVAVAIAKMTFGGLGKNPFNPAIVARIFLLLSFPVDMTTWPKPFIDFTSVSDAVTGPTILSGIKEGLLNGHSMKEISAGFPSYFDLFIGKMGGSLGEVSTLALIIGGIFLLLKKVISWHIPFSFIISIFIFTGIFWLINPDVFINPLFHILSGGLMLGAIFMATDYSTSPMTGKGMLIFGAGCGIITAIIRLWGSYPEGVSFAILSMNATVPLINKYCKPVKFGY